MAMRHRSDPSAEPGVARRARSYAPKGRLHEPAERGQRLTVFCHRCGSATAHERRLCHLAIGPGAATADDSLLSPVLSRVTRSRHL